MSAASRVLVTGAASGLGAALADAFERRGDRVLRTDRSAGVDLELDVTSDSDWAAALDHVTAEWGGLDILVNNAGIAGGGRLEVAGMDEWQRLWDVNVLGCVRGTATFTPGFKQAGSGAVINVASLAGLVHPAGMGGYNASKAAVVALTETTGHELAPFGVTAHVVCPSYFRTNLLTSVSGADSALLPIMSPLVENSPTSADDIAAAVLEQFEAGEQVIVPDDAARMAIDLKRSDPSAYDAVMRGQAAKLHAMAAQLDDSARQSEGENR